MLSLNFEGSLCLSVLLYADDLVLMSEMFEALGNTFTNKRQLLGARVWKLIMGNLQLCLVKALHRMACLKVIYPC